MTPVLHVANGGTTRELIALAGPAGRIVDGDGMLAEGPAPGGLTREEAWQTRAAWLESRYGIPTGEYLTRRAEHERALEAARGEVVLWAEQDLYCLVHLAHWAYLLSSEADIRLVLPVDPDARLGRMEPERIAVLHEGRERLDARRLVLLRQFWLAFGASSPGRMEALALEEWPALARARALHLARLPDASGLGTLERCALEACVQETTFADLLRRFAAAPATRGYGWSDLQVARLALDLAQAHLLDAPDAGRPQALVARPETRLAATAAGRATLAGQAKAHLPERWVGGIRLPAQG